MKTYKIDKNKLNEMILKSAMKQSLIARKLGVSEKTISRWATGKVMFIKHHNLEALCQCFQCDRDELLQLRDDSLVQTMIKERLFEKLSPHGNFKMVEQLFLSVFKEDMNEMTKGEVYLILANTNWRQNNYDEAKLYLAKVFEIAKRIHDMTLLFEAYYHQGTIASIEGDKDALDILLKAYELRNHAKTPYEIGKLTNNISMMYREMNIQDKALSFMKVSYRHFELEDKYYNLCICCQGYMTIYNELKDYESSIKYGELGKYFSEKSLYESGTSNILLYETVALQGLGLPLSKAHQEIIKKVKEAQYFDEYAIEAFFRYLIMSKDSNIRFYYELYEKRIPQIIKGIILFMMGSTKEANELFEASNIMRRIECGC